MKINKILSSALCFVMLFACIVAAFPVSALAASENAIKVTVKENDEIAKDADKVKAIAKESLNYGAGKLKFDTAAELLAYEQGKGYLDSIETAKYSLYVNRYTGFVYYVNNITGQILTSNPIDPAYQTKDPDKIITIGDNPAVMSQLEISYFQVTNSSNAGTYNSLNWIMEGSLLTVTKGENGINMNYILGEATDSFVAPGALTAEDFKAHLTGPLFAKLASLMEEHCDPIDEGKAKAYGLKVRDPISGNSVTLNSYNVDELPVFYENGEYHTYRVKDAVDALRTYAEKILGKTGVNKEKYDAINALCTNIKTIVLEYTPLVYDELVETKEDFDYWCDIVPVIEDGKNVYYMQKNADLTTLRLFNRAISQALPEYTADDAAEDMDKAGFTSGTTDVPSFRITVNYSLDENGAFKVTIPTNSISFNEEVFTISEIMPLKYFGAGDMSRDGYIFFPDGSGTVIEFSDFYSDTEINKVNTNMFTTANVYGQDFCLSQIVGAHREQVTMPVFGMVSTVNGNASTKAIVGDDYTNVTNGFFAVLEEGASLASLSFSSDTATHKYAYAYTAFSPFPSDVIDLSQSLSVSNLGSYRMSAEEFYNGNCTINIVMLDDANVGAAAHATGLVDNYYISNYVGMATYYRDYLIKNGVLTPLSETSDDLPLYIEALGSIDVTKRILTFPVTVSEPLTSFADVEKMYAEFSDAINNLKRKAADFRKEAEELDDDEVLMIADLESKAAKLEALADRIVNITNVNFRLTGFANGGMYYKYPAKLKWEKSVGGKRGFKKLLDTAAGVNAEAGKSFGVYPDFDFVFITATGSFDGIRKNRDAARLIDNRYATKQVYDSITQKYESLFTLLASSDSFDKLYGKFEKKYGKFDVSTLSASTLGSVLNSNYDEDNFITREDSLNNVTSLLKRMTEEDGYSLMLNGGNIYSVKYADHIIDVSTDSSHFKYSSFTVPFMGMVLHGYVNYTGSALNYSGSPEYDILRSIENGAGLYYILCCQNTNYLKEDIQLSDYYGIDYNNWYEKIVEQYATLNTAIGDLQNYNIVDHQVIYAERIIDSAELMQNRARLAEEYISEISVNLANAVDIKLKAMRNEGKAGNGLKLVINADTVKQGLADVVGVDVSDAILAPYIADLTEAIADFETRYSSDKADAEVLNFGSEADIAYDSLYSYTTDSVATDKKNYVFTDFTCDNGNVVMVTYSKTVDGQVVDTVNFILNYNNFAVTVIVEEGAEPITLDGYDYYRINK